MILVIGWLVLSIEAQTFTKAQIGQSIPLAGASNLLTVTLMSDTTLTAAENSVITISGLETGASLFCSRPHMCKPVTMHACTHAHVLIARVQPSSNPAATSSSGDNMNLLPVTDGQSNLSLSTRA